MKDDGGAQVPAVIKAKWQRWCIKAHPDKGGDHETFTAMNQKYEHFKVWFKAHLEDVSGSREAKERTNELSRQGERAENARKLAEDALANSRYDDAIASVKVARAELQIYVKNKKPTGPTKARCEEEERRLNEIEFQVEEHKRRLELERQQREEHKALAHGLKALLHDMLGADGCSARSISGQFEAVLARYNHVVHVATQRSTEIDNLVALQDENERKWAQNKRTLEARLHEAKQSFDSMVKNHRDAEHQWAEKEQGLETQLQKAKKEIEDSHKAAGVFSWLFGTPADKITKLTVALEQQQKKSKDLNARLQSSESRVQELTIEQSTLYDEKNQLKGLCVDLEERLRQALEDKHTNEERIAELDAARKAFEEKALLASASAEKAEAQHAADEEQLKALRVEKARELEMSEQNIQALRVELKGAMQEIDRLNQKEETRSQATYSPRQTLTTAPDLYVQQIQDAFRSAMVIPTNSGHEITLSLPTTTKKTSLRIAQEGAKECQVDKNQAQHRDTNQPHV